MCVCFFISRNLYYKIYKHEILLHYDTWLYDADEMFLKLN